MNEETPQTLATIPRNRDLPAKGLAADMTVLASGIVRVETDQRGTFHILPQKPKGSFAHPVKYVQIGVLEPFPTSSFSDCTDHYHFEVL